MENKKTTKKSPKNKIEKSLLSLIAIILILSSILAVSIYYQKAQNQITAQVTGLEG